MKPTDQLSSEPCGGPASASLGKFAGRRIGLLGGTFDPIHLGHVELARLAITEGRLDKLYFLPALAPPHKEGQAISDFEDRAEMVRLALASEEKMDICLVEKDLPPPSYTIKTLRHLAAGCLSGCQVFFVIGSDSLFGFPAWHDYEEILAIAHLLVAARPGCDELSIMARRLGYQIDSDRWWRPGKKDIVVLPGHIPAVSSSALRTALRHGRESPLLSPPVAAWLRQRRLYGG